MINVIFVFGTLIAINLGVGYLVSENIEVESPPEATVTIEEVDHRSTSVD